MLADMVAFLSHLDGIENAQIFYLVEAYSIYE